MEAGWTLYVHANREVSPCLRKSGGLNLTGSVDVSHDDVMDLERAGMMTISGGMCGEYAAYRWSGKEME